LKPKEKRGKRGRGRKVYRKKRERKLDSPSLTKTGEGKT